MPTSYESSGLCSHTRLHRRQRQLSNGPSPSVLSPPDKFRLSGRLPVYLHTSQTLPPPLKVVLSLGQVVKDSPVNKLDRLSTSQRVDLDHRRDFEMSLEGRLGPYSHAGLLFHRVHVDGVQHRQISGTKCIEWLTDRAGQSPYPWSSGSKLRTVLTLGNRRWRYGVQPRGQLIRSVTGAKTSWVSEPFLDLPAGIPRRGYSHVNRSILFQLDFADLVQSPLQVLQSQPAFTFKI